MTTTQERPANAPPQSPAPARRSQQPRTPVRPHSTTFVSLLAVTTSAWALNPLLAAGRWALLAFTACLILAWGTAWLRTWVRSAAVPTLVGFALLVYALTVVYLSPPRGLGLLPDGDTIDRLGRLAEETSATIFESVAPLEITPGLEAAAVGGICAVYLLVELCCFGLRAPAWSAVPLLALWAPAIVIYIDVSALTFFLAVVMYIALVALASDSGPLDAEERRRRAAITTAWAVVLAALTLAVTPLALRAPGWGSNPIPILGTGAGGALLLNNELDMRQDLGRQSNEVALRYHVAPSAVGALRLRTMHEFDGVTWHLDGTTGEQQSLGDDVILWPEDVAPELLEGEESVVDVEIVGLREERLPIPVFPRVIDAAGRWTYDASRDEVLSRQRTSPGERYSFRTTTTSITPELLRTLGRGDPDRASAYLDVPASPHAANIAARTREITAGAESTYDQAILLQSHLRSRPFEYQTVVPAPVTGDAVWDFLESGQGYCVQFATAMTIMARTLGIPARMAIGFLPGTAMAGAPRTFEVRGDRAHTWPELYFEGVGWVRFEPTPALQSGLPPVYADPFANAGGGPTPEPEIPTSTAVPTPGPTTAPGSGGGGAIGRTLGAAPGWLIAAGITAILLITAAVVLVVRRARHRATERLTPESAWRDLRRRLAAIGITWSDAATPRDAGTEIRRQLERRTRVSLAPEAQDGLAVLVRALEAERYAPRPSDATGEELGAAIEAVLAGATVSPTEAERSPVRT